MFTSRKSKYSEPVILFAVVLTVCFFIFDLLAPAGITTVVLYVLIVLMGLSIKYPSYPVIAGIITTILSVAGFFLSPTVTNDTFPTWVNYFNRTISIFGIWLSVFVIHLYKRYENQFEKQEEQLNAQFQYSNEGIMISDKRGRILLANPSAEAMFGYEEGELTGSTIETLVPNRYSKEHVNHRKSFFHNPTSRPMGEGMELFGKRKDGTEFPVEISLSYYTSSAGSLMALAFISDITERKIQADALKKANESLKEYSQKLEVSYNEQTGQFQQINRLNRELEVRVTERTKKLEEVVKELQSKKEELAAALTKEKELNELKSRFVSMASHEFRTPLSTILSSVSLINRYSVDQEEKRQKHINRIKSSVKNLTAILDDFLSLGKLEEGKVKLQPEEVQIKTLITEITEEMQALTEGSQKIQYQHSGNEDWLLLDKRIIQNILHNLLSNAIKYSGPDGLIEVTSDQSENTLRFTVKDHGIGIPENEQQYMFTRFFRGGNATNIQGTGLGLNIVQKYVEMMNGKITFESKLNEGSVFTVEFFNVPTVKSIEK